MLHRSSVGETLLAVITAMALAVVLIAPLCVSAQGTDPESVIRTIIDALNAKNIDAALALVADDAVITLIPPPPSTTGVFTGKEEIRGWWEQYVADNSVTELSDFQVDGDNATWSAKIWADEFRALGVAPLDYRGEGIVQGGLLKSYTWTMTDQSLEKLGAAVATLPVTGGVLFPTHTLAMTLGGLAVLGGLVLVLLRRLRKHGA